MGCSCSPPKTDFGGSGIYCWGTTKPWIGQLYSGAGVLGGVCRRSGADSPSRSRDLKKGFPMKEMIERNVLRFGRNLCVAVLAYATVLLISAPVSYVHGVIAYGNSLTDLWAFWFTFKFLAEDLYLFAVPVIFLLAIYEVGRGLVLGLRYHLLTSFVRK